MLETAIDTPTHARAYHPHVTIDRVGIAIARACYRVPWRADCLIQALAAQRWLRRHGIPSRVAIGIRESGANPFEAHAWLISGDTVVTGGDVRDYLPLLPRG
ncbi:hypothetical protein GCM10023325_11470 [Sphingomonas lutea]